MATDDNQQIITINWSYKNGSTMSTNYGDVTMPSVMISAPEYVGESIRQLREDEAPEGIKGVEVTVRLRQSFSTVNAAEEKTEVVEYEVKYYILQDIVLQKVKYRKDWQWIERTDTTAMADEYPRTLSRGDQQRVAIASALAMNTEYLVLDEPTSGQDGREKKRLVALMESLQKKGITIILVTHDMDIVARDCTRVIVIANKQVAFDDTPDILFSDANRPEDWGLAYPPAVLLGRRLPGAPYCRDMDAFCSEFLKRKGGASR